MKALLTALGNPEGGFSAIQIAGTNGKGSTAVMIASILEEAGYAVGLYTSPHLEDERERVQIWDGIRRMIDRSEFDDLMSRAREAASSVEAEYGRATVFEIYTAAAYLYFAEQKPDYVVLECGLGGRLDSTNTLERPLASVIAQIGLDHTALLGDNIEQIAWEKAGIIKPGVPVVSQTSNEEARRVLRETAENLGTEFIDASEHEGEFASYDLAMRGRHQIRNAATAVLAVRAAGIEVSDDAVENGLANAYLPGRFEIISEEPCIIIDGAHNPDAVEVLIDTFSEYLSSKNAIKPLVIFGCMKDKNHFDMIKSLAEKLPSCDFMSVAVAYDRAEDPEVIREEFISQGCDCTAALNVREACEYAAASGCDCMLVTGSIYLAGEMRSLLRNNML